jgi:hypothetical protein
MGHLGYAHAARGSKDEAEKILRDLQALSERSYVPASAFAEVQAGLADKDRALASLERAFDEHDFAVIYLRVAPWFRTLRGDARFDGLTARLGRSQPGRD